MSSGLGVLGCVATGIVLGVWLSPAPVPETKVVKIEVPKVYTKKVVEEKIVTKGLPKICQLQLDTVNDVQKYAEKLLTLARNIEERASSIGLDSLYEPQQVVDHHEYLYNTARAMDMTFYDWQITSQRAKAYSVACKQDIEKSNDGDEIDRIED